MKHTNRPFCALLTLTLLLGLCACGGAAEPAAQPQPEPAAGSAFSSVTQAVEQAAETPEPEPAAPEQEDPKSEAPAPEPEPEPEVPAFPPEGDYTMFATESEGYVVTTEASSLVSVLTLAPDGTGRLVMDGETSEVFSQWTLEGEDLTLVPEGEDPPLTGKLQNGILVLDVWGMYDIYFARDGADTSAVQTLTPEEAMARQEADEAASHTSLLYRLWKSLDPEAGVHLHYVLTVESPASTQEYDVQGQGRLYYSLRTTEVNGYVGRHLTFFQDGVAYSLQPDAMTGVVAATVSPDTVPVPLGMDAVFSAIQNSALEVDYDLESREMDGVTYRAEVFPPAIGHTAEEVFLFDNAGRLAYYINENELLGQTVYAIDTIDEVIDPALFDISGYEITQ